MVVLVRDNRRPVPVSCVDLDIDPASAAGAVGIRLLAPRTTTVMPVLICAVPARSLRAPPLAVERTLLVLLEDRLAHPFPLHAEQYPLEMVQRQVRTASGAQGLWSPLRQCAVWSVRGVDLGAREEYREERMRFPVR